MEKAKLIKNASQWVGKKILVIGDVGLDEYVMGQVRRISPEAPVPVLEVDGEDVRLGLAANVAQNITSLGGEVFLISVVGADTGAATLQKLFSQAGISWQGMVEDTSRPTTRKMRVMAQHHHVVRVDYELRRHISAAVEAACLKRFAEILPQVDAVILQDYAKGVVTASLTQTVIGLAKSSNKLILVDPHRSNPAEFYAGADLIKPNYDEAVALSGLKFDELRENPNKVLEVGRAVQAKSKAQEVVLTQGQQGMTIFTNNEVHNVPTFARKVFDVTGAGDTVIAALALGLAAELDLVTACTLANYAAGVVVGKIGCVPCGREELVDYIETANG
ncbi:MAG: D-glycero-beta-D-manno-heptose-7-phosphate kinase [Pseudobdellovibrionaceae bacterium]